MRSGKIPTENVDTSTYGACQGLFNSPSVGVHSTNGEMPKTVAGAQALKSKALGTQVFPGRCRHELSESSYNNRADLSDILDVHDNSGIIKLMKNMLSAEDYLKVWRSCHGGIDPALGLLFHLASNKGTTLEDLWAISSSCGFQDVSDFIESEFQRSPSIAGQRLDKQTFQVLLKIAEMTSESPNSRLGRAPWKNIASSMGLSTTEIANLNSPASQGRNSGSLTMAFISFMTAKFPFTKIAVIAQGLVDINRTDVLKEDMFEKCRKEGCIML